MTTSSSPHDRDDWALLGTKFKHPRVTYDLFFKIGTTSSNAVKVIQSHKSFIQMRSDELAALCGTRDESTNIVSLPDVQPNAFLSFHSFLYTNQFHRTKDMTDEDLEAVLTLAKLYCPAELDDICNKLMGGNVRFNNVFKFYEISKSLKSSALESITLKYIEHVNENPKPFIKSDDFLGLDSHSLERMLQFDSLRCPEIELFKAVLRWGNNQQGLILRDQRLLHHIRFPLMTSDQFVRHVAGKEAVMSTEDQNTLLVYFCVTNRNNKPSIWPFTDRPRAAVAQEEWGDEDGMNNGGEEGHDEAAYEPNDEEKAEEENTNKGDENLEEEEDQVEENPICDLNENLFTIKKVEPQIQTPPQLSPRSLPPMTIDITSDDDNIDCVPPITVKVGTWIEFVRKVKKHKRASTVTGIVDDYRLNPARCMSKIMMPDLKKVVLDLSCEVTQRDDDDEPNEVMMLRKHFDALHYVFFKKNNSQQMTTPQAFFKSKVDFELVMNGCKFLIVSRADEEIIIGFGGAISNLFIKQLTAEVVKDFRKLTLVEADLAAALAIQRSGFEEIILWSVYETSPAKPNLGLFLRKCVNLQNLVCYIEVSVVDEVEQEDEDNTGEDLPCIDLEEDLTSGNHLVRMAVCGLKLVVSPFSSMENLVKSNLTELYTGVCYWSKEIFEKFHIIFPILRKVQFRFSSRQIEHKFELFENTDEECSSDGAGNRKRRKRIKVVPLISVPTVQLMANVIKIKSIEWIRVAELKWPSPGEWRNENEKHEVLEFFKQADFLTEPDLPKSRDFLLTKDSRTGKWSGKAFHGREAEHPDNERYDTEMDRMEYDNFRLKNIFREFEDYENYNP